MHPTSLRHVTNTARTATGGARADPSLPEHHDASYRGLGIALAAAVSASFWIGVLATALPLIGIVPTAAALYWTAGGIAAIVCATLLALASED